MIAAAYLLLTMCAKDCSYYSAGNIRTAYTVPQKTMDRCLKTANAINKDRSNMRAICVPGI